MTQEIDTALQTAMAAVHRLIAACRKGGPLYTRNPKSAAQVSRTAKWLQNAITRLQRELDTHTSA